MKRLFLFLCRLGVVISLVVFGIFENGCSPFPTKRVSPPFDLFKAHSGWISIDFPRKMIGTDPDGNVRIENINGWRRWKWNGWEAIDINLDGYPDIVEKK